MDALFVSQSEHEQLTLIGRETARPLGKTIRVDRIGNADYSLSRSKRHPIHVPVTSENMGHVPRDLKSEDALASAGAIALPEFWLRPIRARNNDSSPRALHVVELLSIPRQRASRHLASQGNGQYEGGRSAHLPAPEETVHQKGES